MHGYIDEDDYRVVVNRQEKENQVIQRVIERQTRENRLDYKTVCEEARKESDWPKK